MLLPALDLQILNSLSRNCLNKSSRQLQVGEQRDGKIHCFAANHIVVRQLFFLIVFRDIDDQVDLAVFKIVIDIGLFL